MASRGKKGGGKQSGDSGKAAGKNGKHAPPSTAPKGDSAATSEGKGKDHTSETAKQQKKK